MTASLFLHVEDLAMRFGRNVLFRHLGFTLEGGRSLAVTGPNGSGKSTLLRILAGVLSPERGVIRLEHAGTPVPSDRRPLHTGLVAPYLNVYDGLSARENLRFLARARRLPNAQARIEDVLARVGLTDRADAFVETYSSGMKQRVKFAAALLADPLLILLDEPSTNLDEAGLAMVDHLVAHQRSTGRLLVLATNVATEAARCDATLCITDFR